MKYFTKIRFFLLIAIFCCITLGISSFNSSPTSLNTSDQSTCLKSAATSNYKLDLNITWGFSGYESGQGIALDNSGNIYISGVIDSFGWGDDDAFIAKFDISGNLKAINNWGDTYKEWAYDIAIDDAGYIYITGYILRFGANSRNAFIAKYDCFGLLQWSTMWDSGKDDYGKGIAIDDLGNIYITGYSEPSGAGNRDAFVAKFDSAGTSLANFTWDGGSSDYGHDIAINGTDIYITGYTNGMGAGLDDAFIAKFNSTLDSKKNITWGGVENDWAYALALNAPGVICIAGRTVSYGDLNGDAFIATFNNTLDSKMNITWHPDTGDNAKGIALDNSGNIYIMGHYANPPNSIDVFIAKFDSNGKSKTNITWGGSANDYGTDIALDDSGSIYITGTTESHGNGNQAFIAKYKPIAALGYVAHDDDDDDDDDATVDVRLIAIIILASIGSGVAIIYILIKKGIISSSKNIR